MTGGSVLAEARHEAAIIMADNSMRPPLRKRTHYKMLQNKWAQVAAKLANALHEELGQHLAGTLLTAGALSGRPT